MESVVVVGSKVVDRTVVSSLSLFNGFQTCHCQVFVEELFQNPIPLFCDSTVKSRTG